MRAKCLNKRQTSPGFTLLEVLIAITLTGLVMGSLFALQSQNKQLTFKSLAALDRIIEQRALLNSAWIGIKPQQQKDFRVENINVVAIPESLEEHQNFINKLDFQLESFDITDSSGQIIFSTMRSTSKQE